MSDPRARLLVVDDHEDNRDLLARRLERRGYTVDVAADGPAALAAIDRGGYDLVLLDVMMPGMSGVDVLARVRERYSKAELPVLMATAKIESQDVVSALAMGANDYVTKPLDFPVVVARIESHLELRAELAAERRMPVLGLDGSVARGTVLDGRYEVLEVIGEGGFAIVFKARQLSTGQTVALKLLRAHRIAGIGLDGVERKRFEREMKLIGQLRHPHIVRLVDSGSIEVERARSGLVEKSTDALAVTQGRFPRTRGESAGTVQDESGFVSVPYLVMEYIDGRSLSAILRERGAVAPAEAVDLLLPVLGAVGEAHRAGIIHRDLKPPNIMVVENGRDRPQPKVLDFGIAKRRDEDTTGLTLDAGFVGTPEYMSPEQARGAVEVTAKSDQYALGVLLYECITGRRPVTGESFIELVHAVATGAFAPPTTYAPSLPKELEAVVLRAMHVDPASRFASLEAFGAALLPFASPDSAAQWASAFPSASRAPRELAPRASGRPSSSETISLAIPPPPERTRGSAGVVLWAVVGLAIIGLSLGLARALAPATSYRVDLRVHPSAAEIHLDGERVGRGALRRELPRDGKRHTIRVVARGYVPETLTFADAPPEPVVELEALEAPPATAPIGTMPTAVP